MADMKPIFDIEQEADEGDPDETPIQDRSVSTQPYDLVVESLMEQISGGTIFLRPISERPDFQRRYVWNNKLASKLIESILLNVPIPACYLSQNEDFELDVIDGQQRLFSIYRFLDNQFVLMGLEVLKELNGLRFHEMPPRLQRQIQTHTLRCILITNKSHPEIKFDVFERLNTNTVPLNAQELRNCIFRGTLNDYLKEAVSYKPWLGILGRKSPDKRMRDEELVLRFFSFWMRGIDSYHTPQKHWLNDTAKAGRKLPKSKIQELDKVWKEAIDATLVWFEPEEAFRRENDGKVTGINRALFDLVAQAATDLGAKRAGVVKKEFRKQYSSLFADDEFNDLISRAVDHKKRTIRRFQIWDKAMKKVLK